MQKRVIILLIILTGVMFLSTGFISAVGCDIRLRTECNEDPWDNIVMGVSALTNAHGENATDGTYNYILCCDFSGIRLTNCNGANKIIGLSSLTNAHSEIPSETNFLIDVCYEDLACVNLDTTGSNCDDTSTGDYPINILSLSDSTNAHIGNIGDYPNSICCGSPIYSPLPCSLTNAYWSETEVIGGAEVNLIVEGEYCDGKLISFEVMEAEIVGDDDPASIQPLDETFTFNAEGTWIAEWIDDNPLPLLKGDPEYYFIATVVGDPTETITSSDPELKVTELSEDYCLSVSSCADYYDDGDVVASEACDGNICSGVALADPGCDFGENPEVTGCSCRTDDSSCIVANHYGPMGVCGDGNINSPNEDYILEQCDLNDLGGKTCSDFLGNEIYEDGVIGLKCLSNCMYDFDECVFKDGLSAECGDGVVNQIFEECDTFDLQGKTCQYFGDESGDVICDDVFCELDTTDCIGELPVGGPSCNIIFEDTEDDCEDGWLDYSWTVEWTGLEENRPADCEPNSERYACPAQVQLPFFNFYNVIIALALIALIYFFLIKKNKNSKKKKKK